MNYITYVYFFPGCVVGPLLTYEEHCNFIRADEKYYLKPKLIDYLSELCLFCSGALGSTFSNFFIDPNLIKTKDFTACSFLYQAFYIYIYSLFFRLRYMAVWGLNNMSVLAAGVRTVDDDGKIGDRLRNINWCKVELGTVTRDRISNWNIGTTKWLNLCFYQKFIDYFKMDRSLAKTLTFTASALWHGFYPAYYVSFFFWKLLQSSDQYIYRLKGLLTKYKLHRVYVYVLFYLMNVPGAIFMNIILKDTWLVCYSLRYWLVLVVVFYLSLRSAYTLAPKKPKKIKKKQE